MYYCINIQNNILRYHMSNKMLNACAHEMSLGHSNEIPAPFYGHVIKLIRLLIAE